MDDNDLTAQMPKTIGRYQVHENIGYGAMGAVYKAFDPLIKRTLAIKTIRLDIPKQSPQYKSFIERFYHEARISGTLSHPNIVTLFDIGEEGGLPYLAMEFVEGETISSMLERGIRFNPEKVIGLVSQIASAIDYAHSKGVIHRDIKPSNLILYDGERVKVTDFGIAKLVDAEMTQSGTLLGTPSYMSPEQAMGDKLDGRSDIFSLGVCAFEMLAGEQPFPGNNVTSILYKLVHVDPIEPSNLEMNGLVPEKWHQVFGKVLAKKPDDRYQTASEFVQDLEYCLGAWFGSAMADEAAAGETPTSSTSAAAGRPPIEVTAALPVMTDAPKVPAARRTQSGVRPAVAPPAPPAAETARPAAAAAPPPAPPAEQTLLMKPGAAPPVAVPPAPEAESATVVVKTAGKGKKGGAPSAAPAPAPVSTPGGHEERTIVMKAGSEPARAVEDTAKLATLGSTTQRPHPAFDDARGGAPPPGARTAARPTPVPVPPVALAPAPVAGGPTAAVPAGEATARKGPPLGLILGSVGALLLAIVVIAGILVYRKFASQPASVPSEPPATTLAAEASPAATPPPAPTTGALHIESQPPGASVVVNGEPKGATPLDLADLPLGPYQVALELKGFAPSTQTVTLTAEEPRSDLNLALSRTAPAIGAADVVSNPAGATVHIDGAPAGQTPVVDQKLKVGSHRVEMTKEGFEPWSGTLSVPANRKGRLEAQLKAVPKPASTPTPEVFDANKVYQESEVDTPPKKLSGRSAEYPSAAPALRRGQRASVTVSFVVNDNGDVTDLQVVESGGSLLDETVLSAFRTWKFAPAVKHGTKVKVKLNRRHTFLGG